MKIVIKEVENQTIGKARFKPTLMVWLEHGEDGVDHLFHASCRIGEDKWSIFDKHAFAPRTRRQRGPRKLADPEILVGSKDQAIARLREIATARHPGADVEITLLLEQAAEQSGPSREARPDEPGASLKR